MTDEQNDDIAISPLDWQTCLNVLELITDHPEAAHDLETLERLIARLYKKARKLRRQKSEIERKEHDRQLVKETTLFQAVERSPDPHKSDVQIAAERKEESNGSTLSTTEPVPTFRLLKSKARNCYICKHPYREVHHCYHLLCPSCSEMNYEKRQQTADLTGRKGLVTGGRIKIGYQTALKLLRCGAEVTITTRFPQDAALRYASETDFESWKDRLSIRRIDFLNVSELLVFIQSLSEELSSLDILINNAAQSVKRSKEYYRHLFAQEHRQIPANLKGLICVSANETVPSAGDEFFSEGKLSWGMEEENKQQSPVLLTFDQYGEIIDQRDENSWTLKLDEVSPLELLEVFLINANAPCLLTGKLKPLFLKSNFPDRYIINVTGLDGRFHLKRSFRHPHLNMSKAALNMMTRTSAPDYANDGIFMNSVDTGWITHEGRFSVREKMKQKGFIPPLDAIDGAARILDPIVMGMRGTPVSGTLFRHYEPSEW